jgi:hypothetical protein
LYFYIQQDSGFLLVFVTRILFSLRHIFIYTPGDHVVVASTGNYGQDQQRDVALCDRSFSAVSGKESQVLTTKKNTDKRNCRELRICPDAGREWGSGRFSSWSFSSMAG